MAGSASAAFTYLNVAGTTSTTTTLPRLLATNIRPLNLSADRTTTTTLQVRCEAVQRPNEKTCREALCPQGQRCSFVITIDAAGAQVAKCGCTVYATTTTTLPARCEAVQDPNEKTCLTAYCPQNQRCKYAGGYDAAGNEVGKCVCSQGTTTTIPSQVRCEAVTNPNEKTCYVALCPKGERCSFVISGYDDAGTAVGKCMCKSYGTTTTTLEYPKCEDISNPSARMCLQGDCPPNRVCRYRPTEPELSRLRTNLRQTSRINASSQQNQAANQLTITYDNLNQIDLPEGSCDCVPCDCDTPVTTTTLHEFRCEAVKPASPNTCVEGACPSDYECLFVQTPGVLAAVAGHCKCVPKTTTTTLSETRCEAVKPATPNTCAVGFCPQDYACRVVKVPGTAGDVSYCKCLPKETTTTLPGEIKCEAVKPASANTCVEGICPPDYDCRFTQSAATTAAVAGHCRCVPRETTTTIPAELRCEQVSPATPNTCVEGVCPPSYGCRFVEAATAANAGYCKCMPLETTTTLQTRCEAVQNPSDENCANAVCPAGQKCTVIKYTTGSAQVSRCVCAEGTTTTTLPQGVLSRLWRSLFG